MSGAREMAIYEPGGSRVHQAILAGKEDIVSALVHDQPNELLEKKDVYGLSPLHTAVRLAEFQPAALSIVGILVQAGADVMSQNVVGISPVTEASQFKSEAVLTLLGQSQAGPILPHEPREAMWADIRAGLNHIMWNACDATPTAVMHVYSKVVDFLESYRNRRRNNRDKSDYNTGGKTLYAHVSGYLRDHVSELAAAGKIMADDDLLLFYCQEWPRFKKLFGHMSLIFRYLDRHYVIRDHDERHSHKRSQTQHAPRSLLEHLNETPPSYFRVLCLDVWKESLLDKEPRLLYTRSGPASADPLSNDAEGTLALFDMLYEGVRHRAQLDR